MLKQNSQQLKTFWVANQTTILIVAAALLLTIFLLAVRAGAPFAGFEAESTSLSGNALTKSASGTSGGQYVEFTAGSTNPPSSGDCSGTAINPGDDWQAKSNSGSAGTTFCIKAGMHRMQTVAAKDNQKFIGETGAIISGAKVLTGWQQSGSDWYIDGQTQGLSSGGHGPCRGDFPRCGNPEDLFINGKLQRHVASKSDLGSGKWFFDYGANRIYIRENPSGKTVETSVLPVAFKGGPSGVQIKNLTIERYATPNQDGAVGGTGGTSNWLVEGNDIGHNHAVGVRAAGSDAKVINNYLHHNGMLGAAGGGNSQLFEDNELAYNAEGGFSPAYAAGSKWAHAKNMIIRGNYSHNNRYSGLWADGNNIDILFENNRCIDNHGPGIFYEIGHDAIIRNNHLENNGHPVVYWADGGGIHLNTSQNVEIYGNTIINNKHGISIVGWDRSASNSVYGEYVSRNINVHDNFIRMESGYTGAHGGNTEWGTIKFSNNRYELKGNTNHFRFNNRPESQIYDWDAWRNLGQDSGSSYTIF